jgi:hypothetical protein
MDNLPGLIGAGVGLVIGWVDFKIVAGLVERKLRDTDESATRDEKDAFEKKVRLFRLAFFVATVCFFPVVGYILGQTIAG